MNGVPENTVRASAPGSTAAAGKGLRTPSGAKVPPAWTDVWITTDPTGSLQATGRDSKGRRVYLYSAEHAGKAAAAKFARLKYFGKAYPALMRRISRDMSSSEEATVLYLIAKTGFRVGDNSDTRAAVKAFGASTLRCSQVGVEGSEISFDFTGKKGVRVTKVLKNSFLAARISGSCRIRDKSIFKTTDNSIRGYLNSIPGGAGFNVKDFRTYVATVTALRKIKTMPAPANVTQFKKYRREIGKSVAEKLGNSPTIALNSYIPPEVFCYWEPGSPRRASEAPGARLSLSREFLDCVHYDTGTSPEEKRSQAGE